MTQFSQKYKKDLKMAKKIATRVSIPEFPNYRDPKIEKLKRNPPKCLRKEPQKNAIRACKLEEYAEDLERLSGFMWRMVNEEVESAFDLCGIKHNKQVMILGVALLTVGLQNRWLYSHAAEARDVEKLTGDTDRLAELVTRAERTKKLIKDKAFVDYDGELGESINAYVKLFETKKWMTLTKDLTKSLKQLRRQMFYLDHDADEIIRWKDRYLKISVKIERFSILCLDLMLPTNDEKIYKTFEEYAESLN